MSPRSGQEGNVLVSALVFALFIAGPFAFFFLRLAGYEVQSTEIRYREEIIVQRGEEALSMGIAHFAQVGAEHALSGEAPWEPGGWEERYKAFYSVRELKAYSKPLFKVIATVTDNSSSGGDTVLSLYQYLEAATFGTAELLQFHRQEGNHFLPGDLINGAVYSGEPLLVTGNPVFGGEVRIGASSGQPSWNNHTHRIATPAFREGVVFTESRSFDALAQRLKDGGQRVDVLPGKAAQVELDGNGYILRFGSLDGSSFGPGMRRSMPVQEGLFFTGPVYLKGVLKGVVTIGSASNVIITDDVLYHDSDPRTGEPNSESESMLGVISEKSIYIRENPDSPSFGKDMRVNGVLIAQNTIANDNIMEHRKDQGTFHFWGSMVMKNRGPIGFLSDEGNFYGLRKNWTLDPRLAGKTLQGDPVSRIAPPWLPPITTQKGRMQFTYHTWGYGDV